MQDFARCARQTDSLARSLLTSSVPIHSSSNSIEVNIDRTNRRNNNTNSNQSNNNSNSNILSSSSSMWVETATRHLQSEEWRVIVMSACALIDTVALQVI